MVNIFLHPECIYKLTESYRIEVDWHARSAIMPEKVRRIDYLEIFSFVQVEIFAFISNSEKSIKSENIFFYIQNVISILGDR